MNWLICLIGSHGTQSPIAIDWPNYLIHPFALLLAVIHFFQVSLSSLWVSLGIYIYK